MAESGHSNRLEKELQEKTRELRGIEEINKHFKSLETDENKLKDLKSSWISSKKHSHIIILHT